MHDNHATFASYNVIFCIALSCSTYKSMVWAKHTFNTDAIHDTKYDKKHPVRHAVYTFDMKHET
jgi:hypothetical protein